MIGPGNFHSFEQTKFWTSNMFFIACSNFLLYASAYFLLPILSFWLLDSWNCTYIEAGMITTLPFIAGLFPLGPFNSFLIDRFKRKKVGVFSLLFLLLLTLLYPHVEKISMVVVIRFLQGILFGIGTMTTGSTLVIDLSVSKMRTKSNRTFVRFGRFGAVTGIALALRFVSNWSIEDAILVSALLASGSLLLLLLLQIQFRAPLNPPKCSLDRFILPSALLLGLNMSFVPFILGILIVLQNDEYFFLCLLAAYLISYLFYRIWGDIISLRQEIELGYILVAMGLCLSFFTENILIGYWGALLIGCGIAVVSNRFLVMMISLPLHCGRGSGNNTYQIFWEVGVLSGICVAYLGLNYNADCVYYLALICCVVGFLMYELIVHHWYHRQMEDKF
ncbi:MAG: MFS transporter [Phocaeicola sp.]